MIRVGLMQLICGAVLVLSGLLLFRHGEPVCGVLDALLGVLTIITAFDRIDPPSKLVRI